MKNKTKGFTLIELLATIVILAIIALIATPIVLNLINTARKGAFARSAEGVLSASKLYYSSSLLENITPGTINFKCNNKECITDKGTKLDIDGNMGTGSITVKEDGKIFFTLTNNKYCAVKYENNKNIILKDGNCSNIDLTNDTTPPIIKNVTVNTTTSSITIVVNAEDMESGISLYEYSIDNGQTYEEENTNTKTFKNLEKKDYKVKVKVYNGTYGKDNYSEATGMSEYEVEDIIKLKDIELPKIDVNPTGWSQRKTVNIEYHGALIQEYSLDGGTTYIKYEGPFTITENMTIVAKASDGTNNITKSTQVTKIDTEKPTVKVSDINEVYSKQDEITLTLKDNLSGVADYCVTNINNSDSCKWLKGKDIVTYEISANGTYYAFSKDLVGNISEGQEFVIDKIDTERPVAKLEIESTTTSTITVKATCNDNVGVTKYEYSYNNGVNYVTGTSDTYTFENLKTGTYNTKVRCSDEAGNSTEANAVGTTKNIDEIGINVSNAGVWSTSKTLTIEYPDNNLVNEYIIINGTATKEDGTVLEAGKWYRANKQNEKVTFTSEGNIAARTSDGTNTVETTSQRVSNIDTTAPTLSVVYKTADGSKYVSDKWTNQSVIAYLTSTDNESGVDHYQMSYNGSDFIDISSNTFTFENSIRTGIWFRAVDKVGNISALTPTYLISIDKISPTVSYNIAGGTYNAYQTVRVTPSDENYASMAVHVYKNGALVYSGKVDAKSTNSTSASYYDVSLDSDGTWTIYTMVSDKAGNLQKQNPDNGGGWYYQSYIVDTIKPTITYNYNAQSIVNWYGGEYYMGCFNGGITPTLTLADAGGSGLSSNSQVAVWKDGAWLNNAVSIENNQWNIPMTEEGRYIPHIIARDNAGNASQGTRNTGEHLTVWDIDTSTPTMSVNLNGYTPGNWTNGNIAITLSGSNSGCETSKNYYYSINDGNWTNFGSGDTATYNVTSDANYNIKFVVTDGWGRWGTLTQNYSIKRDTAAPTYTNYEIKNVTSSGYDVYVYGVSDAGSGVNRVQFPTWTESNGQDDIQSNWQTNSSALGKNQGNGTWYYRVNVSNHNNESGTYNTHIYLYDNLGNTSSIPTTGANVPSTAPKNIDFSSSSDLNYFEIGAASDGYLETGKYSQVTVSNGYMIQTSSSYNNSMAVKLKPSAVNMNNFNYIEFTYKGIYSTSSINFFPFIEIVFDDDSIIRYILMQDFEYSGYSSEYWLNQMYLNRGYSMWIYAPSRSALTSGTGAKIGLLTNGVNSAFKTNSNLNNYRIVFPNNGTSDAIFYNSQIGQYGTNTVYSSTIPYGVLSSKKVKYVNFNVHNVWYNSRVTSMIDNILVKNS